MKPDATSGTHYAFHITTVLQSTEYNRFFQTRRGNARRGARSRYAAATGPLLLVMNLHTAVPTFTLKLNYIYAIETFDSQSAFLMRSRPALLHVFTYVSNSAEIVLLKNFHLLNLLLIYIAQFLCKADVF